MTVSRAKSAKEPTPLAATQQALCSLYEFVVWQLDRDPDWIGGYVGDTDAGAAAERAWVRYGDKATTERVRDRKRELEEEWAS